MTTSNSCLAPVAPSLALELATPCACCCGTVSPVSWLYISYFLIQHCYSFFWSLLLTLGGWRDAAQLLVFVFCLLFFAPRFLPPSPRPYHSLQPYNMLTPQAGLWVTENAPAAWILPSPETTVISGLCPVAHVSAFPPFPPPLFAQFCPLSDVLMCGSLRCACVLCRVSFVEL